MNNFTSAKYNTVVGSFSDFLLTNINSVKSIKFSGTIDIKNVNNTLSDAGITLFNPYTSCCLAILYFSTKGTVTYSNVNVDIIIPATIFKNYDSSGQQYKIISCSPITYGLSGFVNFHFSNGRYIKLYNTYTGSPLSCNIDMYLEVVE